MFGYVKYFNDGKTIKKTMSFNVTGKKLLKKYTKILEKFSSLLNKDSIVTLFMVIMINT